MHASPTKFVAKLLAALQVLMTLDMPLSTTMALPVTSKPIESTVENLAWQAWIELPPEQKQQVKSRKVTPKSIFTLPLRVECPEGHKKVDSKCIPIAIGSNDVLIDLSALGLLVGSTPTEDIYDYDDMGEELSSPLAFGSEMSAGEAVKPSDSFPMDLKPPAKDEPLRFNIFENKFHIFHEEPLEDYAALLNEGLQSSEREQNMTVTTTTPSATSAAANVSFLEDLVSEASNFSENIGKLFDLFGSNANKEMQSTLNLNGDTDFQFEAISIPAFGNHSSIQLVTTIMDVGATTTLAEPYQQPESDLTTLLQTESFLPLLNHTTATTLQNPKTVMPLRQPNDSSYDLGIDEDVTTLTTPAQQNAVEAKNKQEHTRSVTLDPLLVQDNEGSAIEASGDNDQLRESTFETMTIDDTSETTTPIQLDDTTIIESYSSLSTTAVTAEQPDLKDSLLQQEQTMNTFEKLQHLRKGQKDQEANLKKSKVQPVEATTTEATTTTTATATAAASAATTTGANLPTATKSVDELLLTTAETATPLLTAHNENENNDRFYNQHLAKQDNKVQLIGSDDQLEEAAAAENVAEASSLVAAVADTDQPATTATTTTTTSTTTETTAATTESSQTVTETSPLTSEIDLAKELKLINDLVKGKRKPTTKMPTTTATTTTLSTGISTPATIPVVTKHIESSSSSSSLSESTSSVIKKSTQQIWSKILPLLTTSTIIPPVTERSAYEDTSESKPKESNVSKTFDSTTRSSASSERSNRNSKIIRINGFNKISAAKLKIKDFSTTQTTTTPTDEHFTSYPSPASTTTTTTATSISQPASSTSTENLEYEPYWWLPAAWRVTKPTSTETQAGEQNVARAEDQPLLLRFWSHYVPKLR